MEQVQVRLPRQQTQYEIKIADGLLGELGSEARAVLGPNSRRVVLVSNQRVFELFGRQSVRSLRRTGFKVATWLMREGERHKSLRSWETLLKFVSQSGVERGDGIVAVGGGVVGDLAGFAAATYLRGVAFINGPTTLLAQIDASVGGKTAVNLSAGKNLVGAFHQPRLVLIDTDTLQTLPRRELTAGWCEAVKQGAIGGRELFDQTVQSLRAHASGVPVRGLRTQLLARTIAAHCRFKASIVAGDERESLHRDDDRSRRILNFGHTTAHALEAVTGYRRFRHGEAVGLGMLVAGEISKSLVSFSPDELESLREAVKLCGPLPPVPDVPVTDLVHAMKGDKKSVAGQIKWILLEEIGKPRIVDASEINTGIIRKALRAVLQSS